jgi:ABC-type branched-subunit amino acid transport system substrate-binding protein
MNIVYICSCIFILQLATTFAVAEETPATKVLGVQAALTGDLAALGTDAKNGLIFANDYFFHGKYKFIFEDDHCDAKAGISAAQKLSAVDKVPAVFGITCNNALLSSAPIYEKAGTFVFGSMATSGDTLDVGKKNFRLLPADHIGVDKIYPYIAQRHKKLGILTYQDEYTALMERSFVRVNRAQTAPLELVLENVAADTTDVRSVLLRLKSKGIDAIFINSPWEARYIEAIQQMHTLGMKVAVYTEYLPATPPARTALGKLDEGVVFANLPKFDSLLNPEGKKIIDAFIKQYGKPASYEYAVVFGIESLRIYDQALTQKEMVPEEFIRSKTFQSIVGPLRFDQYGAIASIPFELQTIRNGQVEVIE